MTEGSTPGATGGLPTPPRAAGGKVLVSGASGYVGRHVLPRVVQQGFTVRALVREESDRSVIAAWTDDFHRGDVTRAESLRGACEGCVGVVHLVGVIHEKEGRFEEIHVQGTRHLLEEARRAGARVFVYLSGLGAREDENASQYHQTKYAAEQSVRHSELAGYCFPASVIFGPEDKFLNLFVELARSRFNPPWPFLPLIGGGESYLQPVWVEDVAACLARALREDFALPPGRYELGGPRPLKVKEIMRIACRVARRERIFVPVPILAARVLAFLMELCSPDPLLTRDQLIMLQEDGRAKQNRTADILGRPARDLWDYAREHFGLEQPKRVAVGAAARGGLARPQEGILWKPAPPPPTPSPGKPPGKPKPAGKAG